MSISLRKQKLGEIDFQHLWATTKPAKTSKGCGFQPLMFETLQVPSSPCPDLWRKEVFRGQKKVDLLPALGWQPPGELERIVGDFGQLLNLKFWLSLIHLLQATFMLVGARRTSSSGWGGVKVSGLDAMLSGTALQHLHLRNCRRSGASQKAKSEILTCRLRYRLRWPFNLLCASCSNRHKQSLPADWYASRGNGPKKSTSQQTSKQTKDRLMAGSVVWILNEISKPGSIWKVTPHYLKPSQESLVWNIGTPLFLKKEQKECQI